MKVLALLSGGKDSVAALHIARLHGWDVVGACTLEVVGEDSHMFHRPNTRWTALLAEALEVPLFTGKTEGEQETELEDLGSLLRRARDETQADAVVSGAIASEYQRTRIERIGHRLGLKTFAPLWHKDPHAYVHSLIAARFHIHIVATATDGLGRGWLGRKLTRRALTTLERQAERFRFNIAGEGGEYETLVTDGPGFRRPLEVVSAEPHWHRDAGWWEITEARLGEPHDGPPPIPLE
ncbi:MAG: diphthine--ammonia ligase [Euryarchaeota archaeon]|nr:diphthine--ammonia ligase [Euryarchaeota archaeon]